MKLNSKTLIGTFRELFINYGIPEEISGDGGPQFTSLEFQNFILNWGIKYRRSSANYPQSPQSPQSPSLTDVLRLV